MPHFTKRLEVDKTYLNFYFNLIFSADGVRYHVSVVDKQRKLQAFNMKEVKGKWVMVEPENCPHWLAQMESEFAAYIAEHRAKMK